MLLDHLSIDSQGIYLAVFVIGFLIWGVYTKYIPRKANAIVIAIILVAFIVFSTYGVYKGTFAHYKWVILPLNVILGYLFYWIFIKDGGENQKLL